MTDNKANVEKLFSYKSSSRCKADNRQVAIREDGTVFTRYEYYYKGYKWSAWEKGVMPELPLPEMTELDPASVRIPTLKSEIELAARLEQGKKDAIEKDIKDKAEATQFFDNLFKEFESQLEDDCEVCRVVKESPKRLHLHAFGIYELNGQRHTCKTILAMCHRAQEMRKQHPTMMGNRYIK